MKIKFLGATGRHPFGKASADDEGELQFAVGTDHSQSIVRIEFGKPVGWLGLPESSARELGLLLVAKADELKAKRI